MREEGIVSIMHAPLRIEDKVIGMLNLYRKRYTGFTSQDASVAQAFAEHAAIAIQNARLYASIRKNYLDTVRALSRAIEARDSIALGHSERVAETAVAIARVLPLPENEVQMLEFGALLHDLGKISLEDQILLRPGHLTPDEEVILQMHPLIGKSILDPIEFLRPAIPILMYHHERWDGLGYPEGLCAEEIPLIARIVAVANGMDHIMYLSSPFPIPQKIALEELAQAAGTLYDPRITDALATALQPHASAPIESQQSIPLM
jgi:HD-GYP domain-containing protein (c-di-GMP phosphodiesterase class II)